MFLCWRAVVLMHWPAWWAKWQIVYTRNSLLSSILFWRFDKEADETDSSGDDDDDGKIFENWEDNVFELL